MMSLRPLDFLEVFPPYLKIGEIFLRRVALTDNIKLNESYMFVISIISRFFDISFDIEIPFLDFRLELSCVALTYIK